MAKGWHGTGAALAALMLTTTLAGAPPATAADQQPTDPRSEAILQAGAQVFVPPQRVAPQVTLVARAGSHVEIVGPRGTRVWTASAMTDTGIPAAALRAYHDAATTLAREDPTCRLPWTLLAAIGRVESDHGRYGGSVLSADGVSHPSIIGIPLNGAGPVAAIRDTDGGRLDGDTVWDRAVGPMQFLPSTWAATGRDGNGDGKADPQNINDAALTAATYLCRGSGSVSTPSGMAAAVFRYNPSDYYVALVTAIERGYRTGVFVLPSPPPPPKASGKHPHPRHKASARTSATVGPVKASSTPKSHTTKAGPSPSASGGSSSSPKPKPAPSPSPTPSPSPSPSPSPTPSPSPSPTPTLTLVALSGTWQSCGTGWCAGSTELDLGPAAQLAAPAARDYDGDGTVESNAGEMAGLAGHTVDLQVGKGTSPAVVYVIGGLGYRNADGTFTTP